MINGLFIMERDDGDVGRTLENNGLCSQTPEIRPMPKFKPVSIKELLRVGQVEDEELAVLLTSVLPRGAQLSSNDVEYRTAADEWAISLRYKDGVAVDGLAGPAFTSEIEEEISKSLAAAFDNSSPKVWRTPMFSLRRVEGWYRDGDDFLIRPAPEEAPRPDVEYAQHPWILEFTFQESSNWQLRMLRTQRRAYELALILNLLLGGQIDQPTNRGRHHWVLVRNAADGTEVTSNWCQEGYFIPGLALLADEFSDTTGLRPLAATPTETYYSRRGFDFQPLTVPAAMEELIGAASGLKPAERGRFLRSCYWLHMADVV